MAKKSTKKETPLMQQYKSIKAKYPDALLLFRVGDFYETFGEDAIKASKILDIILTKRANGSASHIELAGFPHHSLNTYLPKLVKAGLRVAICDQLEDPKQTKTIVKRGVTELVTPGVVLNDEVLSAKSNNFLLATHQQKDDFGLALLDISTGEFLISQGNKEHLEKIIQSFRPNEIIHQKRKKNESLANFSNCFQLDDWAFQYDHAYDKLKQHFKVKTLKGFGIEQMENGIVAAGSILVYLESTHHFNNQHITSIQRLNQNQFVWMDPFTISNLELIYTPHNNAITLLSILDDTKSAMGARLLRRWLVMALKNVNDIKQRQQVVACFLKADKARQNVRDLINQIIDIERTAAKIATKKITPKQVYQLAESLALIEQLKIIITKVLNKTQQTYTSDIDDFNELKNLIFNTVSDEAPHQINKGQVIKQGVSKTLDDLRNLQSSGKDFLEKMRQREIDATGIANLKIAFNNVFGYYIEVRNTHKDKVPQRWVRKQTLVNAERYITEELKEYESQILGAEEKILTLESELFEDLLLKLTNYLKPLQQSAKAIAQLDVLSTFAELAYKNNYTQPQINESLDLHIIDGRHPVIEKQLKLGENYIANNVSLAPKEQQIIMITGPNMSGKSALLRQTALIVLMAQIGSFVPAKSAQIGVVDKIFTRVGASDNISSGESTFMVEMNETSNIMNNLSERSLILLDEIGRGTSTYDGISIAWAIAEFLHEHKYRPKTLFATHYHELNEMTQSFSRIKNYNVSIKETKDSIIFLRKLIPGGSEHSFGIHVAKMAGMPPFILKRAYEILSVLEQSPNKNELKKSTQNITQDNLQLSFFQLDDPILEDIREELLHIDIDTLTPVEALMKLNEIKRKLRT